MEDRGQRDEKKQHEEAEAEAADDELRRERFGQHALVRGHGLVALPNDRHPAHQASPPAVRRAVHHCSELIASSSRNDTASITTASAVAPA